MIRELDMLEHEALMFVYGTLRPGEGNYWIEPAVDWFIDGVTVAGEMRMHNCGGFPVANFERPGTITGTLLCIDTTAGHMAKYRTSSEDPTVIELFESYWDDIVSMETGAGYDEVEIAVILPAGLGTVKATAWHYRSIDNHGPTFTTGDWKLESDQLREQIRQRAFLASLDAPEPASASHQRQQNWWAE